MSKKRKMKFSRAKYQVKEFQKYRGKRCLTVIHVKKNLCATDQNVYSGMRWLPKILRVQQTWLTKYSVQGKEVVITLGLGMDRSPLKGYVHSVLGIMVY